MFSQVQDDCMWLLDNDANDDVIILKKLPLQGPIFRISNNTSGIIGTGEIETPGRQYGTGSIKGKIK